MKKENTDPQGSSHHGFVGWYEKILRKYKRMILSVTLLLIYLIMAFIMGLSVAPAIFSVLLIQDWTAGFSLIPKLFFSGFSLVFGFLVFGFSSILVIPLINRLILPYIKPFRGAYYSVDVIWWYFHNILTYSVRYTFLEWITPTPFNLFFYRKMGMTIGDRVELNTTNISDPSLITLEDGVTIGGSVTIIAHYAVHGYLIIAPVIIRKNATLGLRSVVMGGAEIGEGSKVLPNSVVLPKTVIPAGETWAGVPAKKVDLESST